MTEPQINWLRYEREIHHELVSKYPEADVAHNVRLPGSRSGTSRQIDILVEETLQETRIRTAIDAKYHARRIDVKEVESFIGLPHDVGVDRGIMMSAHAAGRLQHPGRAPRRPRWTSQNRPVVDT